MKALWQQHSVMVRRILAEVLGGLTAASFAAGGCSNVGPDGPSPELGAAQAQALSLDPSALLAGRRRTLVDGINAAENQWFTSSGRLLVSGDDGIYEIVAQAAGQGYTARPIHTGEACQFGGLTELRGTLYANCYDSTNSLLFAAALSEQPQFRAIHPLPGTALANGLTTDGEGQLFIASTFDSSVLRLRVSERDPLSISSQDTLIASSGIFTNGIKYRDGTLYWTALMTVNAATIARDGTVGPRRVLSSALTVFDDLYVDGAGAGALVADFLNGTVVMLNPSGKRLGATPDGTFDGPSSVAPAQGRLGLPAHALIVTERSGNRVSLFEL